MTLEEFAVAWGLKIEDGRINGQHGYFAEYEGEIWAWTHSHALGGHQFFPIRGGFDEIKAMLVVIAPTGST
jgi:hypothetical protein